MKITSRVVPLRRRACTYYVCKIFGIGKLQEWAVEEWVQLRQERTGLTCVACLTCGARCRLHRAVDEWSLTQAKRWAGAIRPFYANAPSANMSGQSEWSCVLSWRRRSSPLSLSTAKNSMQNVSDAVIFKLSLYSILEIRENDARKAPDVIYKRWYNCSDLASR